MPTHDGTDATPSTPWAEDTTPDAPYDHAAGTGGRVSSTSILGDLRARHEAITAEQVLELPVPRWHDPEIVVRYRPATAEAIAKATRIAERAKGPGRTQAEINVNVDVLIEACVGVFAVLEGKKYSLAPGSPDGDLTRFDADLAENLGLDGNATARQVVRTLFITDGDIISHARRLGEWSGWALTTADEDFQGE